MHLLVPLMSLKGKNNYFHRVKYFYCILIFLLGSCALSGDQESTLNSAVNSFVDARNNGVLLSYVAYTHPNAVAYYKDQGDSLFVEKFDLSSEENSMYLQDGNIREIKSEGSVIHVKYDFLGIIDEYDKQSGVEVTIYAISNDDGVTWFFMDASDYENVKIVKKED